MVFFEAEWRSNPGPRASEEDALSTPLRPTWPYVVTYACVSSLSVVPNSVHVYKLGNFGRCLCSLQSWSKAQKWQKSSLIRLRLVTHSVDNFCFPEISFKVCVERCKIVLKTAVGRGENFVSAKGTHARSMILL